MQLIISSHHFEWRDVEDCLGRARGLGMDGVELSWEASAVRPHCSQQDLAWLATRRQQPICPLYAHIWDDLARLGLEQGSRALLHWLELCERTGVRGLVVHGGSFDDRRQGIALTRHIFERVLGRFEKAGVVINLENHYPFEYYNCRELFSEAWEFLEVLSLDSPSLRFCYDTGHAHMAHNERSLLLDIGRYLNHVHLADNHGIDDDHCMFGQGSVPWAEIFDTLEQIGYDKTFCVEFPVRQDRSPFDECIRQLRHRFAR